MKTSIKNTNSELRKFSDYELYLLDNLMAKHYKKFVDDLWNEYCEIYEHDPSTAHIPNPDFQQVTQLFRSFLKHNSSRESDPSDDVFAYDYLGCFYDDAALQLRGYQEYKKMKIFDMMQELKDTDANKPEASANKNYSQQSNLFRTQ